MKLHRKRLAPSAPVETKPRYKFKAVIAYDGTAFAGWQYQGNAVAVQQVVEEALGYLEGAKVRVYGSSRTDAGVHARMQMVHFDTVCTIPPDKYRQ